MCIQPNSRDQIYSVSTALLGTQAYFHGEQSKAIHARNWRSESLEKLAKSVTGAVTDYGSRVPGFDADAHTSNVLPMT